MTIDWRDILEVHPAAELFPLMAPDELMALAEDIKKNGLNEPIVFWTDADYPLIEKTRSKSRLLENYDWQVIDGRNRLNALELLDREIPQPRGHIGDDWMFADEGFSIKFRDEADPYDYVISANIHRRHLTAAQKSELIEALLKAKPERSDRATAKIAQVDHKTVAAKRAKLEATGEIPQLDKRTGADGRARPHYYQMPSPEETEEFRNKAVDRINQGLPEIHAQKNNNRSAPKSSTDNAKNPVELDVSGTNAPVPESLRDLKTEPPPQLDHVAIAAAVFTQLSFEDACKVFADWYSHLGYDQQSVVIGGIGAGVIDKVIAQLGPIAKDLITEGKKHMATISPSMMAQAGVRLQRVLDEWAGRIEVCVEPTDA
jgi:hypothetical protein